MTNRKRYTLLSLLGLLLVLTLASPLLARWQLGKQLEALGAEQVRIEGLYLNIWSGYFRLRGLEATARGRAGLQVGELEADLDMAALFKRRLHLARLQLSDTETVLIQGEKSWLLGPLQLPLGGGDEPAPRGGWSWGLSQLGLKNLRLETIQGALTQSLAIDQASLDLLQNWFPDRESRLSLEGNLNGSPLRIGSTATPLSQTPRADSRLRIERLDLGPLLAPWLDEKISAKLSSDLALGFSQNAEGLILEPHGTITLTGVGYGDQLTGERIHWQGQARIGLSAQGLKRLDSSHDLTLEGFRLTRDDLRLDESRLQLVGTLKGDPDTLAFAGKLDSAPLTAVLGDLRLDGAAGHWQGAVAVNLLDSALESLEGDARLEGLVLKDHQDQPLVSLKQLTLEGLQQHQPGRFGARRLALEALRLSGDDQPLLTLEGAELQQLEAGADGTAIESLALGALTTGVHLDSDGNPRHWPDWIGRFSPTPSTAPASNPGLEPVSAPAPASAPYPFSLGRLSLTQPARLAFTDSTVTPVRELSLTLDQLQLEALDTTRSEPVPFSLRGRINRFGDLELAGRYAWFAREPVGEWTGQLRQLELPPFSPYMERHIGYQLRSGQLQLETQGSLAQGQVQSSNGLTIHKLQVRQQAAEEAGAFDRQLGMPLETVISILTDEDDDLALQVPISGSLDDPRFGYQSVINLVMTKVTTQAAIGYLTVALQPYGALITLTRMAVKQGNAIELAPVFFTPGTATFDAQAEDYLGKLEAMLKEREGIRLNLCGTAVATDARALQSRAAAGASVAAPSVAPVVTLDETQLLALHALAQQRADRVKAYLQQQGGIGGERLFGCLPRVNLDSEARPQVMLGL